MADFWKESHPPITKEEKIFEEVNEACKHPMFGCHDPFKDKMQELLLRAGITIKQITTAFEGKKEKAIYRAFALSDHTRPQKELLVGLCLCLCKDIKECNEMLNLAGKPLASMKKSAKYYEGLLRILCPMGVGWRDKLYFADTFLKKVGIKPLSHS